MFKKVINYIFIYICLILLVSCQDNDYYITGLCISDCFLELEAPNLELDENGYYHMEFLSNYTQTFTTLDAFTGAAYVPVAWYSDSEHLIQHMGNEYTTDIVNQSSYTNENGVAHTVLGPWSDSVGDTVKVYCIYEDECGSIYQNNIEVIIDE